MYFENIIFRGENALATIADASNDELKHPPLATIPVKKCTIPTDLDGTYTGITFELDSDAETALTIDGSVAYTCTDSGF